MLRQIEWCYNDLTWKKYDQKKNKTNSSKTVNADGRMRFEACKVRGDQQCSTNQVCHRTEMSAWDRRNSTKSIHTSLQVNWFCHAIASYTVCYSLQKATGEKLHSYHLGNLIKPLQIKSGVCPADRVRVRPPTIVIEFSNIFLGHSENM